MVVAFAHGGGGGGGGAVAGALANAGAAAAGTTCPLRSRVVRGRRDERQRKCRSEHRGPDSRGHGFAPFFPDAPVVARPACASAAAKGIRFASAGGANAKSESATSGARFQSTNWARNSGWPGAFGYVRTRSCGSG